MTLYISSKHLFPVMISQTSLTHTESLQRSRYSKNNGSILDTMLSIPDRASPEQDICNSSHGFVQWVLEETGVTRPLPVKKTCCIIVRLD